MRSKQFDIMEEQTVKKRRPGAGRKKKENTLYKEGDQILRENYPQVAEAAVRKALGEPVEVTCPACKHVFMESVLGTGDTKLIQSIIEQIRGKPVQKQEIDLNAHIGISNQKLVQYHLLIQQATTSVQEIDITPLESQIKLIPEKVAVEV